MTLLLQITAALLALVAIIALISRHATKRDQQRQAQADFGLHMKDVFNWSQDRNQLSLTAAAMQSINEHRNRINDWQAARKNQISMRRARRDYLAEYTRLQRRHDVMVTQYAKQPENKTYRLAITCQAAITSLTAGERLKAKTDQTRQVNATPADLIPVPSS